MIFGRCQNTLEHIGASPSSDYGQLFNKIEILISPYVLRIIEQGDKHQAGLVFLHVIEVHAAGHDMVRDAADGPAGAGAQQKDDGSSLFSGDLKVDRPVPSRPASVPHRVFEGNLLIAEPPVHFVRRCLQSPAAEREPEVGDAHDGLGKEHDGFSEWIVSS